MTARPFHIRLTKQRINLRANSNCPGVSFVLASPRVKPAVKWAGGKQWLAPAAQHLLPTNFHGRYFEPFFGGGAMFFAFEPRLATLSDRNEELINAYDALRRNPEGIIRLLSTYPHRKSFYYALRDRLPRSSQAAAARFLYLNRTCWNGLYRVNRRGEFNTPFGRYKNPTICDPKRLRLVASRLQHAQLRVGDFEEIVARAEQGDFVYMDPPYITGHSHNGFLKYNAPLFSWIDQQRLAEAARSLAAKGVYVLINNADSPAVINLYSDFCYYKISRRSLIASDASSRSHVHEAMLSSYPLLTCGSTSLLHSGYADTSDRR